MTDKEKSYSKIQWFFLVIFIPIVFTAILAGVILSLLGVNVIEKAKDAVASVPFVADYVAPEEEEEPVDVAAFEQTIAEQQAEVERLQSELTSKEEEISQLEMELVQLAESQTIERELAAREEQELEDIAKTYEAMSAKNAAAIISDLPIEEALLHISQVSIDVRADILGKMDSELAAELMSRLANS